MVGTVKCMYCSHRQCLVNLKLIDKQGRGVVDDGPCDDEKSRLQGHFRLFLKRREGSRHVEEAFLESPSPQKPV